MEMKAGSITESRKMLMTGGLPARIAAIVATAALFALANISSFAQAPPVVWAGQISGVYSSNTYTTGWTALDKNANFFFVSTFNVPVLTVNGQALTNSSANPGSVSAQDVFVTKYDSSGNFLWVRQIGGDYIEVVRDCSTDLAGNLLVSVSSYSTNILAGTNVLIGNGRQNLILCKYDPQGNLIWILQGAGNGTVNGSSVAADASGNVLVAGSFTSTNLLLGTNLLTKANPATTADFLAKYDGAGNLLWASQAGINGDGYPTVGADGHGNIYLVENISGGISMTKFDSAGNVVWAKNLVNVGEYAFKPVVDVQENCYLSGYGPGTGYIAKYDVAGNLVWVNTITGTGDQRPLSLSLDPLGNCYATGVSDGMTANFGAMTLTNAAPFYESGFAAKYSSGGSLLWAKFLSSAGGQNIGSGAADANGNVYVCGSAQGATVFNLDGNIIQDPTNYGLYYFAAKISGPQLTIQPSGGQVVLSWPTNAVGLSLETTTDPTTGGWLPVTNTPAVVGAQNIVSNAVAGTNRFYRLRNF